MALTIPHESEVLLQETSKRTGIPVEELLSRAIIASIAATDMVETDLIRRATETLSEDFWQRYRELTALSAKEQLTEVDRGEFIALVRQANEWNNRRLEAGITLAKHRCVPYEQVKAELHIEPVNVE
jgi:hypothetical protein